MCAWHVHAHTACAPTAHYMPPHAHGMHTVVCVEHPQVDVREAHERLVGLEAFDAGWREAAARHPGRFEIVTHEVLQGAGRGFALTAALQRVWPQLRTCATFQDSDARLLNASTPFCSELVGTARQCTSKVRGEKLGCGEI